MNLFAIAGISCGVFCTILAMIALIFGRAKIHRILALFNISVAIWGYGGFIVGIAPMGSTALLGWRFGQSGGIFIAVFFYHMICILCGLQRRIPLRSAYLWGFFFLYFCFFTDWLFAETRFIYNVYYNDATLFYSTLVFSWLFIVCVSFFELLRFLPKTSGIKRIQTIYIIFGFLIGFIGGSSTLIPMFGIKFPPYGNFTIPIYCLIATYAILRHQLLEIEVIIKKTLIFASLFAVVLGVFVGITVLTQELLAGGRLLGLAISALIIILSVRPLENFLIRITDKYLFQKKYDYKHLIRQFVDELKTMVLNAHSIAQATLDFLDTSIRPLKSAIFLHNTFSNKYDIVAAANFNDKMLKISDNTPLINELKNGKEIMNISQDKLLPEEDKRQLLVLGLELIMPLVIHKDLLGILCLGKKKSDEDYTEEDIEVLSGLSSTLSIAINNAQLFDERAEAEKRAMIGTLATGINHEIGNPLNIITIKLQSFKILSKMGMLAKKTKEEIIDEVNAMGDACLDSVNRIADITKKVAEFAKPDKDLALGRVNISTAIDETMSILSHELELEKVKFEKNIMCDSPSAIADKGQLKQILFNLIKNAVQANDKEDAEIAVSVDNHGTQELSIKVADNGPGIPAENMGKIFTPFYTTKEPGKGTGLGLALVKKMVERNNGRIEVESQEGKGTAFTIILKKADHEQKDTNIG